MSSSRASRRGRLVALLLLGAAGCLAIDTPSKAPPEGPGGTWTPLAPMPSRRQEVAAAEAGGTIYVLGGFGDGFQPSALVEAYDPASGVWQRRASLPVGVHHPAPVGVGSRTVAPLPLARGGLAAAPLRGRIFVLGGELPFGIVSEAYDPATERWTAQAPLSTPRHGLGAAAVGARVYVAAGGTRPGPGRADVLEAFEP
jgi:hypothetical protein